MPSPHFTDRARMVLALANKEARGFGHEYIGTEHILLGLISEGTGTGATALKASDVDLSKLRTEVEQLIKRGPNATTLERPPQTPRAKKVLEYALEESRNLNHNYVGTEHLLLGMMREEHGVAGALLVNFGLTLQATRDAVLRVLGQTDAS